MEQNHQRISRSYFSALDWFLLAAVAVAISLGAWAMFHAKQNNEESVEIRYRILIEGVNEDVRDAWQSIPIGSTVTNERGTAVLGHVTDVSVVAARRPSVVEGTIVMVERADLADITVTVTGRGQSEDGQGLRILSHRIAAGSAGSFRIGACYAPVSRIIFAEARK